MADDNLSYPDDFPEGIPPEDARPASGNAYRLVRNTPPVSDDFCGYYKEPYLRQIPKNPQPQFFGTSMFRDLTETKVARKLHKPQRDKRIATGSLIETFGVISKEKPNTYVDSPMSTTKMLISQRNKCVLMYEL